MKKSSYVIKFKIDENGNRIFQHVCAVFDRVVERNDRWDIMSYFQGIPEWLDDDGILLSEGIYQIDDVVYIYDYNLTVEI